MALRNSLQKIKKSLIALLAASLMLSHVAQGANAADDSILVSTKPGQNVEKTIERLNALGCTVLGSVQCKVGRFYILRVKPANNDVTASLKLIQSKVPGVNTAEKSFTVTPQFLTSNCTTNDPDFGVQYHMQNMSWAAARCTLSLLGITQNSIPRITLIDSGCNQVFPGDEMTNVKQFNFVGGLNGLSEFPIDSGNHGTAVISLAAARTNNGALVSGIASMDSAVSITCCRVADPNQSSNIDTLDVLRAMTWCVDNQATRGGAGAINISLNSTALPTYNGSGAVQLIARQAHQQGDIFVNGAGNDALVDPSPELYLRRIGGLDETGQIWKDLIDPNKGSRTGPFDAYCYAVNIPALVTPNSVLFGTGTSLSCVQWAAIISLLQSLNPRLNALKADSIIYRTTDKTPSGMKCPNIYKAVLQAVLLN